MRARVVDQRHGRVAAREDRGPRAEIAGELDDLEDLLAVARREALERGRLDVRRRPLDAELRRESRGVADHVVAAAARPDAAQERRLRLPHALDRLVGAIGLHVVLDAVGRAAQRELAQRHQVALAEEVARGALDLLGQVDLAGLQPREQVVGGDVDEHHLVGLVEEEIGHRLENGDAGDAPDDVVQALEVLDVERREDVDAGREQLVDILPALRMARALDVRVGELVDEDQRGPARERAVEVELAQRPALEGNLDLRQHRQVGDERLGLLASMRLDDADEDVLALVAQRARGREHRERLADAGGRAEVDAQASAPRGRLARLHLGEELIRIGALVFHAGARQVRRAASLAAPPLEAPIAQRRRARD